MKLLLIASLFILSSSIFAAQNWTRILETGKKCEMQASVWKLGESSIGRLDIHSDNQTASRPLVLRYEEMMNRPFYYSSDDQLPFLKIRMTFIYESSLPMLSVYDNGKSFLCVLDHVNPL